MCNLLKITTAIAMSFALLASLGCRGDVKTTPDSTKIEVEVPKIEVGKDKLDLNPKTDGDLDIDTPKQGDS
jgi:hypothetical protein